MDTRNSPTITPTHARPTFIFIADTIVEMLAGSITFCSIWNFVAPKVRSSLILSGSTSLKPLCTPMVVTTSEIISAMAMMAWGPAPIHTRIIGPRAILGRLFITTR